MKYPTRNIGILAHVDAGKTTITEQILFQSGALRTIGSVDKGTSITDNLKVERERGISVRLATASFLYRNTKINLIDTPGHVDFCAEVEYSLRAMDAVILVVSALEGVQGHTVSLFQAIKQLQIPCVIFINKIDRVGVDIDVVMEDINQLLTKNSLLIQQTTNPGSNDASIEPISFQTEQIVEQIVEFDDELLESYLQGKTPSSSQLQNSLKNSVTN